MRGRGELERMASELAQSMCKPHCRSCERLQGFLTRLMLDADESVAELLSPWRVGGTETHGGEGCDLCPAADLFEQYLREGS